MLRPMTIVPRDYQVRTVDEVVDLWSAGRTAVCMGGPTGVGKTVMAGYLAQRMRDDAGGRIAFLTDRLTLIPRTLETFSAMGLSTALIQAGNTSSDARVCTSDVVVVSSQTASARNIRLLDLGVCAAVIDETHAERAATLDWLASGVPIMGMTATPLATWMHRKKDIGYGPYQALVTPLTTQQAIQAGWLRAPVFQVGLGEDPAVTELGRRVGRAGEDWSDSEAESIMSPYTLAIAEAWLELCNRPGGGGGYDGAAPPTLVHASTIEHASALAQAFGHVSGRPDQWRALTEQQDQAETDRIIGRLRNGLITGICAVHKCTVGVDVPDLAVFVSARPTRKLITWAQAVGRTMRPPDGSEEWLQRKTVLDCSGSNAHRFAGSLHSFWHDGAKWPFPKSVSGSGFSGAAPAAGPSCPDHPKIVQSPSAQVCQLCFRPLAKPEPTPEKRRFSVHEVTKRDVAQTILALAQPRCLTSDVGTAAAWARQQVRLLTGEWPREGWPSADWTIKRFADIHPVVRRIVKRNGKSYAVWQGAEASERSPEPPDPERVNIVDHHQEEAQHG